MKALDFYRHLKDNNCVLLRHGSKHDIWMNRSNNSETTVPRHKEIGNIICKTICKQLEIPIPTKF